MLWKKSPFELLLEFSDMQYWRKLCLTPPSPQFRSSLSSFCFCNLRVAGSSASLWFCFPTFFCHIDLQKGQVHCCRSNQQSISDCSYFTQFWEGDEEDSLYFTLHSKVLKNIPNRHFCSSQSLASLNFTGSSFILDAFLFYVNL